MAGLRPQRLFLGTRETSTESGPCEFFPDLQDATFSEPCGSGAPGRDRHHCRKRARRHIVSTRAGFARRRRIRSPLRCSKRDARHDRGADAQSAKRVRRDRPRTPRAAYSRAHSSRHDRPFGTPMSWSRIESSARPRACRATHAKAPGRHSRCRRERRGGRPYVRTRALMSEIVRSKGRRRLAAVQNLVFSQHRARTVQSGH